MQRAVGVFLGITTGRHSCTGMPMVLDHEHSRGTVTAEKSIGHVVDAFFRGALGVRHRRGERCRFGQFLGVGLSFQPETTGVSDRHVTTQAEEAWESDRALPWATSVLSLSRRIGGKGHRPVVDALFRGARARSHLHGVRTGTRRVHRPVVDAQYA